MPVEKCFVGFKHESMNTEKITPGKFIWFFHHAARASTTLGTEFAYICDKTKFEAKFGLVHKFSDDFTGKFKVND